MNQLAIPTVQVKKNDCPSSERSNAGAASARRRTRLRLTRKLSYAFRCAPGYVWQQFTRRSPHGPIHIILAMADHFEPAYVPENGAARASYDEQERRLEHWCREYPRAFETRRDNEGHPFTHTYFYPAEQHEKALIERLAEHCHTGWGEIEIHLHHGVHAPDTAENTRRQLVEFRDALALEHGSLCYLDGSRSPRYAFVHGNFALANSAGGRGCGVDSEMQVLADTGCYADFTLPTGAFHPAQTAKINSLYECALPLDRRAPQRRGRDLELGRPPRIFPLIVQGPLVVDFARSEQSFPMGIDNGAVTASNPASLRRLRLWKRAAISVQGRPDWLFIKLHCHGMDPTQKDALLASPMQQFIRELVEGAQARREILHFVSAREMVNIILAACDGREGNPGEYRDYRLKRVSVSNPPREKRSRVILRG